MDLLIERALRSIGEFKALADYKARLENRQALTTEVETAISARATEIAREVIAKRTGIELSQLTPAEERIIEAVAVYLSIKRGQGTNATRMLTQIQNHGLIGAAESAVEKLTPGFQELKNRNREDLTYERIILDHPEEFSDRAKWFARRTLGEPNSSAKAPAKGGSLTQARTETLLVWLRARADAGNGSLGTFTNADAAGAMGLTDMHRHGRVVGNIISRIDFSCYTLGLPPLGITTQEPFDDAWAQGDRPWAFPIQSMRNGTMAVRWHDRDFARVLQATRALPGSAHIPWQKALAQDTNKIRLWAYGLESGPHESAPDASRGEAPVIRQEAVAMTAPSNPVWSREEHILSLDLYLRRRGSSYSDEDSDVIELSLTLRALTKLRGVTGGPTFRNANGVSMKMTNFRRLDPLYTSDGRVGQPAGSKTEEEVWRDFADDPEGLADAVEAIRAEIDAASDQPEDAAPGTTGEPPYWMFICNPKKWAIDRFLATATKQDSWGVRGSDRKKFAPGQLGIIRVGIDRRTKVERQGRPPLQPGIYAVVEVESNWFPGTGASDDYWAEGQANPTGKPTIRIRYLRSYLDAPLTIEQIRAVRPNAAHALLNSFQDSSFPLPAEDFHAVMELLGEDVAQLPVTSPMVDSLARLIELEAKYANASVEVKTRISKCIERGPIGAAVKKANGYKCQLCEALDDDPIGFQKPSGEPYVEAHHVMPVAKRAAGSLGLSNIMTLCANHHRQLHYGRVAIEISDSVFNVVIDGVAMTIPKTLLPMDAASQERAAQWSSPVPWRVNSPRSSAASSTLSSALAFYGTATMRRRIGMCPHVGSGPTRTFEARD